ncbi:early flowering 3 family protein [Striga asiatica]|uniref:Early flowering 3 family protein n=1 Tax=Striga asiatica TaxID=4170 RepID=A0A5A7PHP2_STRAF|nr:early flowering 3 family protein [Striga asiatica]
MKRGKEEKVMGPMFPRLHVKDTDKGGPRAPPRNKMALYEQLSVPSNNSQGNANERGIFPFYHMHTQIQSEKQNNHYPDSGAQSNQIEQRKKLENDEFAVPAFVRSVPNQEHREYTNQLRKCQKSERQLNSEELLTPSAVEKAESLKKKTDSSGKLNTNNGVEYKPDSERCNPSVLDRNIMTLDRRRDSTSVMDFPSEDQNILHDISNKTEFQDRCRSQQMMTDLDRFDSLSENSVVDSVSPLDVTPDDVVGVIGQKQFWKARREIANQQRIFAVQVFELHRLITVQRLISASPQILLDDSAYFPKPIKLASPGKRKLLNNPLKENPHVGKPKGGPEKKPVHETKTGFENATTEKKAISSASFHNGLQPPSNSGPWSFSPQLLGNQWLIPVMSPSEGLVYKPYPGSGFMGSAYGVFGPPGLMGPQFSCFPPPGPHGYFPPYGMPFSYGPEFSGQKQDDVSNVTGNLNAATEDFETQASIASSPVENNEGKNPLEERNELPLFPMSTGPKPGPRPPEPKGPNRVIKVMPHNARSASESAARIFRAIQEGREKQK